MRNRKICPIIITGAKRSGTTLLQYLFDSVPRMLNLLHENYFFEYLYDLGDQNTQSFIAMHQTAAYEVLFNAIKKRSLFHFFDNGYISEGTVNKQHIDIVYDFSKMEDMLAPQKRLREGRDIEGIWNLWIAAIAHAMGTSIDMVDHVLLKSPDYGKSAVTGFKYLKHCKVIMVVRDPLYSIDSLRRSRQIRNEKKVHVLEILNVIADYRFLIDTLKLLKNSEHKKDLMIIKYEDLAHNAKEVMGKLSAFIGISFVDEMLRPTLNGVDWHGEGSYMKFDGVSSESTKRKIVTLSEWEIDFVKNELREFYQYFNYS